MYYITLPIQSEFFIKKQNQKKKKPKKNINIYEAKSTLTLDKKNKNYPYTHRHIRTQIYPYSIYAQLGQVLLPKQFDTHTFRLCIA